MKRHYDLKRPCNQCPFRIGKGELFRLRPDRLEEIRRAPSFACHKTLVSGEEDREAGVKTQECAGRMAVLHRDNTPDQMMRIMERLRLLDCDALDPEGEAYGSWDDVEEAHAGALTQEQDT